VTRRPVVLHVAAVEYTATRLLLPQLRALQAKGYDARLACAPDGPDFDRGLAAFRPVRLAFPRSADPVAIGRACHRLVRILRALQPDVLHLHTPAAALPARMLPRLAIPARTRVVYTVHGFPHVWEARGRRDRALERVERLLAPRTDLLLFQSREDLAQAEARGYRTRLRYLGNGVEDSWFAVPARKTPSRPLELLFVGRLIREKGVLDLFDALTAVPDVRLTVAGAQLPTDRDGVEAVLRQRAAAPGLAGRVTFTGLVGKAEMHALVARADALVLPSYREGVPRSLIEGFAAGRPAVATDVRGCRELVEDGVTGFLAPPGQPDRLAAALGAMAALSDERYRTMSTAAGKLASAAYRESVVFDRLVDAYTALGVPDPLSVASLRPSVVADDLAPAQLGRRAAPEEEDSGGAVAGVRRRHHGVEVPQPEQQDTGEAAGGLGPGEPAHEVVEAPQQLGAGAGHHAGVDLLEPAEEVAVPARGEAGEVVRAGVDVLEERGLGVHEAAVGQDPVDLGDDLPRVEDVLEYRLDDHGVDAAVRQGNGVGVGDDVRQVAAVEVQANHLDVGTGRVERVQPVAEPSPADDEHPAGPGRQPVAHQGQQLRDVALGDPVERLPDASQ
jgi:glycosyltransferase involved in cell wall biosynthesis